MSDRLIFVLNDPRFFLTHRLPLALAARDAGFDVSVAVPMDRDVGAIRDHGFRVHAISLQRQGLNPFADLGALVALWRLYRRERPHIVHQVTIKPVLYGTVAARLAGVPAVVNAIAGLGNMFSGDGKRAAVRRGAITWLYRACLRHPNAIVVFQNQEDRDFLLEAGVTTVERTMLLPGSGVDISRIVPTPEPDGVPRIVLCARLLRHKGIAEFAAAARILKGEGEDARFVLVGDDADNRDAIPRSQLETWEREGLIELWGWRDDMSAVLAETTIACLPSYYREGIPKALLDAAAAGRPIVTTNTPGCREAVHDSVSGILVPPRDVAALADALRALLRDPELRARMGRAGRELAVTKFNLENVKAATICAYRRLRPQQTLTRAQL